MYEKVEGNKTQAKDVWEDGLLQAECQVSVSGAVQTLAHLILTLHHKR